MYANHDDLTDALRYAALPPMFIPYHNTSPLSQTPPIPSLKTYMQHTELPMMQHMQWARENKSALVVMEAANADHDHNTAWAALEAFVAGVNNSWDGVCESSLDWRGWLATRSPEGRTRTSCETRAALLPGIHSVFIVLDEIGKPCQVISVQETKYRLPEWFEPHSYIISGTTLWLGQNLHTELQVMKRTTPTWTP